MSKSKWDIDKLYLAFLLAVTAVGAVLHAPGVVGLAALGVIVFEWFKIEKELKITQEDRQTPGHYMYMLTRVIWRSYPAFVGLISVTLWIIFGLVVAFIATFSLVVGILIWRQF